MPTYEYRCNVCSHKWDEFQSITAKPTRKCPACGKLKAERIISAGGGIIFKGSGFYQTDYRSESWKKGEGLVDLRGFGAAFLWSSRDQAADGLGLRELSRTAV